MSGPDAELARAKALVIARQRAIEASGAGGVAEALARRSGPDWLWRGVHPFHERRGPEAVADAFWAPLLAAMAPLRWRPDVFFAGRNEIDGFASVWVASMGHWLGLFDAPFLGIAPTRRLAMLRHAEFNRVEGDRIVETALFVDLLHLMRQAGLRPLPPQTGAHLVQPGPATHDGLLLGPQDPGEGARTLALVGRMIGAINDPRAHAGPREELAAHWHEDMLWWGPEGIGSSYTIDRYIEQHQRPFRTQLSGRRFNGHVARLAEGRYAGFFGWPNLTLTPIGGYMGLPANGRATADMRVVDVYRREGDRLAENWVFIDMLHFLRMQGLDVLARMEELRGPSAPPTGPRGPGA